MKKILLVLSSALFALFFVFSLTNTVLATDESAVTEVTPPAVSATGCYNFTNDLYYGINRWKGYPAIVSKLQSILKGNENASILDKVGVFGITTAQAVSNFQEKYKSEILNPQNLNNGTGIVDLLTRQSLNQKYGCIDKAAISLTAPSGKLTYSVGEKVQIKWNAVRIPNTTDVKISYVGVSSKATTTIATVSKVKNGIGTYEWTIPTDLGKGEYKLVLELFGSVKSDQSNVSFTIQEKAASITSPNNGESFTTESPVQIKWNKSSSVISTAYAVIKLQKVGETTSTKIGEAALSTGLLNYIPTQAGEYNVLIEVYSKKTDSSDSSKIISQDSSDKSIKIKNRDLTLTKPTSSDLSGIKPGSILNVGWNFSGKVSNVNIYLVGYTGTTTLLANNAGGKQTEKIASVTIPAKTLPTHIGSVDGKFSVSSYYKIVVTTVDGKFSVSSPSFAVEAIIAPPVKIDATCGTAVKASGYNAASTTFDGTFCTKGSVVSSPAFPNQGGSTSWTCDGVAGGKSVSCSVKRALPIATAGTCGTAAKVYTSTDTSFGDLTICKTGTPVNNPSFPATGNSSTWKCAGVNGGATSALCTATKSNPVKVAAVCGAATAGLSADATSFATSSLCAKGVVASEPAFPGQGSTVKWICNGENGGANVSCSSKRALPVAVVGTCGTAAKTYTSTETSFGDLTICKTGTAINTPSFPSTGNSSTWKCAGVNGGATSALCTATKSNPVKVAGTCGDAAKIYRNNESSFGNLSICKTGTPDTAPSFPGIGVTKTWKCVGENGGVTSAVCTARNSSTAVLTPTTQIVVPKATSTLLSNPVSLNQNLKPGDEGTSVSLLQKVLKQIGLYSGPVNGSFGDLTKKSVVKFQTANALDAVGEVGPKTRDLLNFILSR